MWPISFREFLRGVAVLLLGSGLMFWGASPTEISMEARGSGFALMASAGAFRDFALPLALSGILLLIVSGLPFPFRGKRQRKKKPPH